MAGLIVLICVLVLVKLIDSACMWAKAFVNNTNI